jgi:hypothetical protein
LVRCTVVEATEAEIRKSRRVQRLLHALVAIMIVVPLLLFFIRSR